MKKLFVMMAIAVAALGFNAYAFHSGGVAECGGCHSMHEPKAGGVHLLIGTDGSSTCLSCHAPAVADTAPSSYHVLTLGLAPGAPPVEETPGGDFAYLYKDYTWNLRGTNTTEYGRTHGHNVVAADYASSGMVVDADNATAPGGTFPSSQLACTSCHDPHGKARRLYGGGYAMSGQAIWASGSYANATANEPKVITSGQQLAVGVYRILYAGGSNYSGVTYPGAFVAKVPSTYNRSEAVSQTRVAYGHGTAAGETTVSLWCATCHPDMHSTGNYVHPTDATLGTLANNYNAYVNSGNTSGGTLGTSFLSLVPFAENTNSYTTLISHATNAATSAGPGTSDRVVCLSCHRAHASGFPDMLRWNYEGEFITVADSTGATVWPGSDNPSVSTSFSRGRTTAEMLRAYYDRPVTTFGAYQRQLCNKCHAKD